MNSSAKRIDESVATIKAFCSICSLEVECHNAFDLSYSKLTIVDLFCYCTKIKITEKDNPYYVCLTCAVKLLNAYEFIKLCQESWSTHKLSAGREHSPKTIATEISKSSTIKKSGVKHEKLTEENEVATNDCNEGKISKREPENVETIEIIINKGRMVNKELTTDNREERCEIVEVKSVVQNVINKKNSDITESVEQIAPYFCEKCGKHFERLKSLQKHVLGHGNNKYQCKICQKDFNQKYHLIRHMMTHNDEDRTQAERKSNENLSNGYSYSTSKCIEDNQVRNIRTKSFRNAKSLSRENRLLCHLCNKRFKCRENLKLHLYVHMGIKPHVCEMCGKRFTQSQQLTAHLRTHSGEKPYACEYCFKCFTTSGTLVSHVRAQHTNTRPHVCDVCGKGFVQKPQLTSHLKVHKGDISEVKNTTVETFKCKLCLETFSSKGYLIVHKCPMSYLAPYICETCGKGFNQKTQFLNHTRLHTGERPYVCQICSEGFRSQSILKVHVQRHSGEKPYICEVCGKRFSQQQQLTSHMRVHSGEKPFECDICFKSFSMKGTLTVHRRTHTGETPYVCDGCNAGFYASSALKRHKLKCGVLKKYTHCS